MLDAHECYEKQWLGQRRDLTSSITGEVLVEFSKQAGTRWQVTLCRAVTLMWCMLSPKGGRTREAGVAFQRYFWRGCPGYLAELQGWGERGGTGKGKEQGGSGQSTLGVFLYMSSAVRTG